MDITLPQYWRKCLSKKRPGQVYYFNVKTKESLWAPPNCLQDQGGKNEKVQTVIDSDTNPAQRNIIQARMRKLQAELIIEADSGPKSNPVQHNAPKRFRTKMKDSRVLNSSDFSKFRDRDHQKGLLNSPEKASKTKRNISQPRGRNIISKRMKKLREECMKGISKRNLKTKQKSRKHQKGKPNSNLEMKGNLNSNVQGKVADRLELMDVDEVVNLQPEHGNDDTDDLGEMMDWEATNEINKMRGNAKFLKILKENAVPDESYIEIPQGGDEFLVIDTNVFVSDWKFIKMLLEHEKCDRVIFIIPWLVMQELDHLMKKKTYDLTKVNARRANALINEYLLRQHPRLYCQTWSDYRDNAMGGEDTLIYSYVDNILLKYCLKLKAICNKTALFTNDKNLQSKAIINDVNVFTTKTIKEILDS